MTGGRSRPRPRGTVLCGVVDTAEGREAVRIAGVLSTRIDARLVLAHAVDAPRGAADGVSARRRLWQAERMLAAMASELGLLGEVYLRVAFGDPVELLASVAAEEHAGLIVLGSRPKGRQGRRLRSRPAAALASASPVPVLVVPPQTRARSARRLALAEAAAR